MLVLPLQRYSCYNGMAVTTCGWLLRYNGLAVITARLLQRTVSTYIPTV